MLPTDMTGRAIAVALASLLLIVAASPAAMARGGHGFRGAHFGGSRLGGGGAYAGGGMHGAQFAGGQRTANDKYVKAASDEMDKLLNTRIKSICRGC